MFGSRHTALICALVWGSLSAFSLAQASGKAPAAGAALSAERAVSLAQSGHCKEALPALKQVKLKVTDKDLQRSVGLAGVRCAMLANQPDAATEFLRFLNREFPRDPEVLYLSVHTYSDLSSRAAAELATTAPDSAQGHELHAESLETQGKWEEAAQQYRLVLQQNPRLPGIHFRLGRFLLSKPNPSPADAEEARKEMQQELEVDPSNAGAEYVLGEMARQSQQWDEAIQHFSRAAKLDAGFGDAFVGLGACLVSVKRFTDAVPPLETAVSLEPRNPAAHYQLAVAYSRSGRKQDADREFDVHKRLTRELESPAAAPDSQQVPK
jgi:tetratricopeptide (TPR) repeat protein